MLRRARRAANRVMHPPARATALCLEQPPDSSPWPQPRAYDAERPGLLCVRALEARLLLPDLSLVKDIHANTLNANPGGAMVGGTYSFSADDGIHGRELWKSDGTAARSGPHRTGRRPVARPEFAAGGVEPDKKERPRR